MSAQALSGFRNQVGGCFERLAVIDYADLTFGYDLKQTLKGQLCWLPRMIYLQPPSPSRRRHRHLTRKPAGRFGYSGVSRPWTSAGGSCRLHSREWLNNRVLMHGTRWHQPRVSTL